MSRSQLLTLPGIGPRVIAPDEIDWDDRATPAELFAYAVERWGPFTVDVASSDANAKCPRHFTKVDDGLAQSWAGECAWGNIPFSLMAPWMVKAWAEPTAKIVYLVPATRTEQPWWQDHVEPFRDRPGSRLTTHFHPGRPRFVSPSPDLGVDSPRFGIVFLVWERA